MLYKKLISFITISLLLIPLPVLAEDVIGEVTVSEDFSDSTYQTGLTISGGNSNAFIYCSEQNQYGTTGCALAISSGTYVFEFAEDVYEIGFIAGGVNNSYTVKYYYSDSTDETIEKSGQSNADFSTMYDTFYKSFTDYNNDEANTDKFITKFEVTLSDLSLLDTLYWQYVDESTIPTTTTTTTTTTLPKAEDVVEDNVTTYLAWDKNGCEHPDNPLSFKQYLEAVESEEFFGYKDGDCEIKEEIVTTTTTSSTTTTTTTTTIPPTEEELNFLETGIYETDQERAEREESERLAAEKEAEIKESLENTNSDIPEEDVQEFVEIVQNVEEFVETIVIEEEVIDIPEEITLIVEEKEEEIVEEVIVEPIEEEIEKSPEEVIENIVEDIVIEEITTEEAIEVIETVNDIGLENIEETDTEVIEIISEVVTEVIEIAQEEDLTEEQTEVVAEILNVEKDDVQIVAELAKKDETVAQAVEEFVERAVSNTDLLMEYTLADVQTEIAFENFVANPIDSIIGNIDIDNLSITNINDDLTEDTRQKAQEVVIPTIITRIASLAVFSRRFGT